ncbi:hypothetical protein [Polaromonas sp. CG9_12]|nr:hypothetical protein [Polaromonas sp. CG9_12]
MHCVADSITTGSEGHTIADMKILMPAFFNAVIGLGLLRASSHDGF